MPKGYSIHIGVNRVDPTVYGKDGALDLCENDARAMYKIACEMGYTDPQLLLTEKATTTNFINLIYDISLKVESGDIVFISFSGHGKPFVNKDKKEEGEEDGQDESWCFYNGALVDDDIYKLWSVFPKNTRILVVSDSCHSGTVIRSDEENAKIDLSKISRDYDLKCTVRLLASSADRQRSYAWSDQSLFTDNLVTTWDNGKFEGNYANFFQAINKKMPLYQEPNHLVIGVSNAIFENQKPFLI